MNRQLLLDTYVIELSDEDLVPVNKSVYDVQEPETRKSNFTKTIELPYSRINNQVFASYFDVSMNIDNDLQFDPFYNPTKKVKATYYEESLIILTGYAQLKGISNTNGEIKYQLILFGENADFFKAIEGKKLSDLDLSEYDHTYTQTDIINSWSNTSGYVYPQVKNGRQTDLIVAAMQIKDYWKVGDFDLWFFVKTLWDKIWEGAELNYYSNFINSDAFTKLVYKGNSNGMIKSDSEIENSIISCDLATSGLFGFTSNRQINNLYTNNAVVFTNELQDNLNQYNNTTGIINFVDTGNYDVNIEFNIVYKNVSGSTIPANANLFLNCYIVSSTNYAMKFPLYYTTSSSISNGASISIAFLNEQIGYRFQSGVNYKFVYENLGAEWRSGGVKVTTQGLQVSFDFSRFDIKFNKDYNLGDDININSLLSSEMTQKDFVLGLCNMFNLYIEPYYFSPSDANSGGYLTYLVEPRDDYYTNEVIDWTPKLDNNKEIKILPTGAAKDKFYKFTYDLDKDYYNNLYNQRTGRVFGDVTIDIQNEFLQGTKEIKIPFSLMIVAKNSDPLSGQYRPLATDVKDDEILGVRNDKSKPKIMYYNGLLTGDVWIFGDDVVGTNRTTRTTYPSLSNFDNISNPDNDLCFDTPQEVYYTNSNGQIVVTNQGLYNKYHRKGLIELNNRNSKIYECYMALTSLDVHNLSLRPIYQINNSHFRLYEMIDYNGLESTLCRFLKIQGTNAVVKSNGTTRGGKGTGAWGTNPDLYHQTGNLNDRVRGGELVQQRSVLTGGGITYIPPDKDGLVMLQYRYLETSTNLILTGGEGSPLYILADASAGNLTITMPNPDLNTGKLIIIKHINTSHKVIVNNFDGTLFEEISASVSHEYLLDGGIIIKIR
jgi:hypothetical protein